MRKDTNPTLHADCIVIGAGIAGASLAASLAGQRKVVLLEAESMAGYHSTGRSAALFAPIYGNAVIRALTRASRPFFDVPPAGFAAAPLLRPRETLFLVGAAQETLATAFLEEADVRAGTRELGIEETLARVPVLSRERIAGALMDPGSADIEVDLLHQGFLRQARAQGAELRLDEQLVGLERQGNGDWLAHTAVGSYSAPIVVNAAGAWADSVAQIAGIAPLSLQPLRRTAALIDAPGGADCRNWPAVVTIDESHYFKPDAGLLLISPADETPSPPCDAQPEEWDVAMAVDRFETLTGRPVRRVHHRWAGLRVFSPDRSPVVGYDACSSGFFWCAGHGGYGIQTAPALARLAAAVLLGQALPAELQALGISAAALSPQRFIRSIAPFHAEHIH